MSCRLPICSVASSRSPARCCAQVSPDRILNAQKEPQNWLTYSGSYLSQRYSQLTQITPANARIWS